MAQYFPTIGEQLREPITGRFDCGAYAGASTGDADTLGQLIFTGRQVRLATNEPIPDHDSPGTNNQQVDEALYRLSDGKINLDTQWRVAWWRVEKELRSGKWALLSVIRAPIVDAGHGGGDNFRGAHGITVGYNQALKRYVFLDSLLGGGPRVIPSAVLKAAASAFMVRSGGLVAAGTAYISFSRDVFPEPTAIRYSVAFKKNASFFDYAVNPATLRITGRTSRKFTKKDTSASCEPVRLFAWPGKGGRRLARVKAGVLAGRYVEPGAFGVRLVKA